MNRQETAERARKTADAAEILHRRYYQGNPEKLALLEEERAAAAIARQIFDLREEAGLTQRELAKRVGTTASVICRLENADYSGHSLAMLRRIAAALDKRVEVRFVPIRRRSSDQPDPGPDR
jgi:DNA-binding XRE family transcriptional regulator